MRPGAEAYLGAAPVAALGVVLLGATLSETEPQPEEQRKRVSSWKLSLRAQRLVVEWGKGPVAYRNHWGMGRFCLAALARMTLVLNDLLEGISL